MSTFRETVLRWANERLDAIIGAPPMWGSNEAVEMQVLLLMELRALALRPQDSIGSPDAVFELYTTFLRQRFPEHPPRPALRTAFLAAFRDRRLDRPRGARSSTDDLSAFQLLSIVADPTPYTHATPAHP